MLLGLVLQKGRGYIYLESKRGGGGYDLYRQGRSLRQAPHD